jgi:hypothetical protein
MFDRYSRRMTWKSKTHFVAVSKLDGVPRGPAAADLWRKPTGLELLEGTVCVHYRSALPERRSGCNRPSGGFTAALLHLPPLILPQGRQAPRAHPLQDRRGVT